MNGQPTPVPPNRKTHRLKIVVLIFVGLIALYFAYRHSLALSIQARIDSIHQAGFPATCAELDKWYPQPPGGENAADIYIQAFAHFEMWTNEASRLPDSDSSFRGKGRYETKHVLLPIVGMAKLPPRTEPLLPEMQKLIAEYLSDNAESLRLLHEAASMKSCRYPVDLTNGMRMSLHHLVSVRQAARLLELDSIQHTEEQQPQPAVESVVVSLGVSRSLNQEPTLLSFLVHVACQGIALDSLERMLNRIPLTDEQLATLASAINESENRQTLTRAFVGERCMGVDLFLDVRTSKTPLKEINDKWEEVSLWPRFLFLLYRVTGLLELDEEEYIDIMEHNVKTTELPPPENMAAASRTVNEKVQCLTRWHFLSRTLLPALDRVVIKGGRCAAKIRDAQSALAIERYRLANGKLPDQLTDLVPTFLPTVPTDPFDGKPLRYRTLPKGYVIYSVGDDREDNGGKEKNDKGHSWMSGTDITFTVER